MKDENFYKELGKLIEKGEKSARHPDIDIEAIRFAKSIRSKMDGWKLPFFITLILLLLLAAGVVAFLLVPDFQRKLGLVSETEIQKSTADAQDQIRQLTDEKNTLLENIEMLKEEIETLKSAPPVTAAPVSQETYNTGQPGADGIIRHVVENGETLYKLARKYYGSGMLYKVLQEDNKLNAPEDLAEGMTLKIYPEKRKK